MFHDDPLFRLLSEAIRQGSHLAVLIHADRRVGGLHLPLADLPDLPGQVVGAFTDPKEAMYYCISMFSDPGVQVLEIPLQQLLLHVAENRFLAGIVLIDQGQCFDIPRDMCRVLSELSGETGG